MDLSRQELLAAMGVDTWVLREHRPEVEPLEPRHVAATQIASPSPDIGELDRQALGKQEPIKAEATDEIGGLGWPALEQAVSVCTKCSLFETRKHTVFGVGSQQAQWMIIGEAPGADEDRQGEPFVGRAGRLLNNMLLSIGLNRDQVFIANILKCRPPNNRDPKPEEVEQCEPYLHQQVNLLRPKIILALGRIAAHNLLKTDAPLGRLRGKCYHYGATETPLIVTYHPAYLLRSPQEKRKVWEDLLLAKEMVNGIEETVHG
jgi:uracil-DNA glycosylase family 4